MSPQPSAFISARIPSPDPMGDDTNCVSHLATVPGEDEEQASPRKISSSDALRALSRAPLEEDGTVWTVVNSDLEDAAPHQPHSSWRGSLAGETAAKSPTAVASTATTDLEPTWTATTRLTYTTAGDTNGASSDSEEESSDDDFLTMGKLKSPVSSASRAQELLSPTKSAERVTSAQLGDQSSLSPKTGKLNTENLTGEANHGVPGAIGDEDELFQFEEEGLGLPARPRQTRRPAGKLDSNDGQSDHDDGSSETPTPQPLTLYATSPAIPITRLANQDQEPGPPTPARAKFESHTVGSYRGRPLTVPVLRNPEVLSQLGSARPVNEIVGSVHHRGPTDAFNPASFQESAQQAMTFSSFSERLMMEDMMEAAKAGSLAPGTAPTERGQ
ncbi:uncharacterized protein MAM_07025 [Metarhizium album ARSEF 1941]|uniref:Uncharacterized protein n=1 Tax=Metarhizium album (strain ARSEF 1941) TaxID=1081103 RepID=A0A0B2WQ66_METAS|nr:uncharacterized protein MAM_07025 [Metarhizium album ARSEF 1941]KHN95140.1 hypothetical protein MAM_07025 [Metarhizium album ARSEF 1941]